MLMHAVDVQSALQSEECRQKRRMAHKQKYQRKLLLARICIDCSYVRLFKAPFDFQINEQYSEVKSGCQNLQTGKLLLVKLKSIEH